MTEKKTYIAGDIETLAHLGYRYLVTEDLNNPKESKMTILLTPFKDYNEGEAFMMEKESRKSIIDIESFDDTDFLAGIEGAFLNVYVEIPFEEDELKV